MPVSRFEGWGHALADVCPACGGHVLPAHLCLSVRDGEDWSCGSCETHVVFRHSDLGPGFEWVLAPGAVRSTRAVVRRARGPVVTLVLLVAALAWVLYTLP